MLFDLALERHKLDEARRWFGELKTLEGPQGVQVALADALLRIEDATGRPEALRKLLKDVEAGPLRQNPARLALVQARIHDRLGETSAVIDKLQTALDAGLRAPTVTARLVQLLTEQQRYGEASVALAALERNGPLPTELWRSAIDIAASQHDVARVRELMGPVQPEEVRDYRELLWMARVLAGIDDIATAETCIRRAADIAPHAAETWVAWIRLLVPRGQRKEAEALLDTVKKKAPARSRAAILARCAEALGDWDGAEKNFRQALTERPSDFVLLLAAGDFYRQTDRGNEAAGYYRRVAEDVRLSAPPEIVVRARRGLALSLASTDPAAAREALEPNLARGEPADERILWFIKGQDAKTRPDAIRAYEAALKSGAGTAEDHFRLVQLHDLAAHETAAARWRDRILADHEATPQMLAYFARTLKERGQDDAATAMLERLRVWEPNSPRAK
jgi:tetratricopeptide (TPR) repeat protein